jgi:hypothetical protein
MPAKKDFTQVAFAVVQQATGAAPKPKLSARQEAGRKGGLQGGKKRMQAMTEAQRSELAAKGVAARKKTPARKAGAESIKG